MEQKNNKFWNFVQNENDTEEATLYLDGDITSGTSWWNDTITPGKFTKELQALGNVKKITVHLNSSGGDVFAAHTIATRLKDHSAEIIVKTAWAASAATIIVAAADKSYMPSGGVYMIHNPKMLAFDYYEAKDLMKMAEKLEVIKNSLIEWYQAKTDKTSEEIGNLMDEETWWTGREAVENGFIDELLFDENEKEPVLMNNSTAVINSVKMDITNVPEKIKALFKPVTKTTGENIKNNTKTQRGEKAEMEFKNTEELMTAYPNLCKEIAKNAADTERARIKAIDDVTLAGYEEMATKAKYDKPITAEALSMAIISAEKQAGANYIANITKDTQTSGVNSVGAVLTGKAPNHITHDTAFDSVLDKVLPTK